VDSSVNDEFGKWLNQKYGNYGEVKAVQGKVHEYLGMTLDFTHRGKLIVNMRDYVAGMTDDFSIGIGQMIEITPVADDLFSAPTGLLLDLKHKEEFHTMVAKALLLCKRARPNIHTTISVLCTRVKAPTESDWKRLIRLLKYLNGTRSDDLILSVDDPSVVKWFVDASFAVHPDFRSHTGGMMTFRRGSVQSPKLPRLLSLEKISNK
jgi:hypothetical protein